MQLRQFTSTEQFFSSLDRCRGQIYLITQNGDKYNLKSKLTQLYALNTLMDAGENDYELICSESSDEEFLRDRVFI